MDFWNTCENTFHTEVVLHCEPHWCASPMNQGHSMNTLSILELCSIDNNFVQAGHASGYVLINAFCFSSCFMYVIELNTSTRSFADSFPSYCFGPGGGKGLRMNNRSRSYKTLLHRRTQICWVSAKGSAASPWPVDIVWLWSYEESSSISTQKNSHIRESVWLWSFTWSKLSSTHHENLYRREALQVWLLRVWDSV